MNPELSPTVQLVHPEIVGGQTQYTNILLIDSNVPSYQTFVDSVNSVTFPIVYSILSSKESLLTLLQSGFTNIQRIGMVFTSGSGNSKPFLDRNLLFVQNETEGSYSENLQFIINVIHQFGVKNIDFLACDTLRYSNWANYYAILTEKTGVTVGASNNKTGNIKYGGDWVLESTSQNIETVYFTKSIRYYTYLLDVPNWVTGLSNPVGIVFRSRDNCVYALSNNGIITQIPISNPSSYNPAWVTLNSIPYSFGITIDLDGRSLLVSDYAAGSLKNVSFNPDPNIPPDISTVVTGLQNPKQIALSFANNTYCLYVSGNSNTYITKVLLGDPSIINAQWLFLPGVNGTIADRTQTYLFAASNSNTIAKIPIDNPNNVISNWAIGLNNPRGIIIDNLNVYMYVANSGNNTISRIELANTSNIIYSFLSSNLNIPISIAIDDNDKYLYVLNEGNSSISQFDLKPPPPIQYPCFKEGSRILTNKGYVPIESLKNGDLIKTVLHGYVPICMIGKRDIVHTASEKRIKEQLYKCTKKQYPAIFEDLVLTGCHSILVDEFKDEAQKDATLKVLNITDGNLYITDDYYRLPACVDDRASVYEIPGTYTIYHLALEHKNYYMNYGIYANGLLVESCSQRYLKELSQMELF